MDAPLPHAQIAKQVAFTVRLTEDEQRYFQTLVLAQGHRSVAAAFKAHALSQAKEHPLQEMRLAIEHMQERMSESSAALQDRMMLLSTNLDQIQSNFDGLISDMQACTESVLLIAQTNEALTIAVTQMRFRE